MKMCLMLGGLTLLAACAAPSNQSNHQNLDVEECRALAEATFRAGNINNNLCPGYAPDGQKIELF